MGRSGHNIAQNVLPVYRAYSVIDVLNLDPTFCDLLSAMLDERLGRSLSLVIEQVQLRFRFFGALRFGAEHLGLGESRFTLSVQFGCLQVS